MNNLHKVGNYYVGKNSEIVKLIGYDFIAEPHQVDFAIIKDPHDIWQGLKKTWTFELFFFNYFTLSNLAGSIYE